MNKFSFNPNQVHWYQGMCIMPQHMQQTQIIQNQTMDYLLSNILPNSWGVLAYDLDESSLTRSTLRLLSIQCIMPDYTLLFFPIDTLSNLELQIPSKYKNDDQFFIYLTLPHNYNLFASQQAKNRFNSVASDPVQDITNGTEASLIRLEPNPFLADIKTDLCLPIAKCLIKGNQVNLMPYDPPSPNFHLCKSAKEKLSFITHDIFEKINYSFAKLKMKNEKTDFEAYGSILAQSITPLQHLLSQSIIHPSQIFQAVVNLSASISQIIEPSINFTPNPYNHLDILESFSTLFAFIKSKLDLIDRFYTSDIGKFTLTDSTFTKTLPPNLKSIKIAMYFNPSKDFTKWINNAIIASETIISKIQNQRLLGCKRSILEQGKIINNKITVVVQVLLDQSYQSSPISIRSNIYHADSPSEIYLLEN